MHDVLPWCSWIIGRYERICTAQCYANHTDRNETKDPPEEDAQAEHIYSFTFIQNLPLILPTQTISPMQVSLPNSHGYSEEW